MMTVAELIDKLKQKDQGAEVEYIVVKTTGELVVADVSKQAKPMTKFLKHFQ